jgi:hypothetical protein
LDIASIAAGPKEVLSVKCLRIGIGKNSCLLSRSESSRKQPLRASNSLAAGLSPSSQTNVGAYRWGPGKAAECGASAEGRRECFASAQAETEATTAMPNLFSKGITDELLRGIIGSAGWSSGRRCFKRDAPPWGLATRPNQNRDQL